MESSGFYEGVWDSSLYNPITKEYTGWWDRSYLPSDFMAYFALFVSTGVFVSPTNQLKVYPYSDNEISISAGWAFINGSWYHNDSDLIITVPPNSTNSPRVDSVRIRRDDVNRITKAMYFLNDLTLERGDLSCDLELAQITVPTNFTSITSSMITDIRPNEDRCGFVHGLLEVIGTKDLFSQFEAIFNDWFDSIKGSLTGDLAVKLQLEFEQLNADVIRYKQETDELVTEYKNEIQMIANDAQETIDAFVEKNFIIENQVLTFVDKRCIINNEHITERSLVDVYFNSDTIKEAEESHVWVESSNGFVTLYSEKQPSSSLIADIRIWRM